MRDDFDAAESSHDEGSGSEDEEMDIAAADDNDEDEDESGDDGSDTEEVCCIDFTGLLLQILNPAHPCIYK